MQIAALDLMPLLWTLSVILSVALFLYGERAALARTVPAAIAALILYFFDYPPRFQVVVFLALYILCAAVYAALTLWRRHGAQKETRSVP